MNPQRQNVPVQQQQSWLKVHDPSQVKQETPYSPISAKMTLPQFFELWYLPIILQANNEASEATVRIYREGLARWVQYTGDPSLESIDAFRIAQFQSGMRTATYKRGLNGTVRPLSKHTQKKLLTQVRYVLYRTGPTWDFRRQTANLIGITHHFTIQNPRVFQKEKYSIEQARRMVSSGSEMSCPILPEIQGWQYWRAFVALHFYTGLRRGTISELGPKQLQKRDGRFWICVPEAFVKKTGKAIDVPVHDQLHEALQPFLKSEYFLPRFCHPRHLYFLHDRLQTLAGIPLEKQLDIHAWRRSHACELAKLGAKSGIEVARMSLDHADSRTTSDSYCNIAQELILQLPKLWGADRKTDPNQMLLF